MTAATDRHAALVKAIVQVGQTLSLRKHHLQAAIAAGCAPDRIADHRQRVAHVQADYDRLDLQVRAAREGGES